MGRVQGKACRVPDSGGYTGQRESWYRVRKSWTDESSQKGAFFVLNNAKACADQNLGYSVFDPDGKAVYTPDAKKEDDSFMVQGQDLTA